MLLHTSSYSVYITCFQPAEVPLTTFGLRKDIYKKPRNYEPFGPGYKGLIDWDKHQLRPKYSRHTMPNPQTTSLQSLQNPLEKDKLIPCIADQHVLNAQCEMSACPESIQQKMLYNQIALEQSGKYDDGHSTDPPLPDANNCEPETGTHLSESTPENMLRCNNDNRMNVASVMNNKANCLENG